MDKELSKTVGILNVYSCLRHTLIIVNVDSYLHHIYMISSFGLQILLKNLQQKLATDLKKGIYYNSLQ